MEEIKPVRKHTGNLDFTHRVGWRELGSIEAEDVEWKLHQYLTARHSVVRVTACGEVDRKANYKLMWDGERLSGDEEPILRVHRPVMFAQVVEVLKAAPAKVGRPKGRVRMHSATLGDKYHVAHELGELDGANWRLAKRCGASKKNWSSFKLIADRSVPNKAGYYLEWNGNRFARTKDAGLLSEHRPELYERARRVLMGETEIEKDALALATNPLVVKPPTAKPPTAKPPTAKPPTAKQLATKPVTKPFDKLSSMFPIVVAIGTHYGADWLLAAHPAEGSPQVTLLLCRDTEAEDREVHNLAWDGERFCQGSDIRKLDKLKAERPELYAAVEMAISIYL